MLDFV